LFSWGEINHMQMFNFQAPVLILRTKLTTTAANRKKQSMVGPNLSSYGPEPRRLMAAALQ
jgi:hypothetical protein